MSWEADFLSSIDAPVSQTSVFACDKWTESEGTLPDNNPFAISGKYPGAIRCIAQCGTPSEVWAYDTIEHGVAATVAFMGGSNSADIVAAFRADAGLQAIWQAINSSPWCSGCQGGLYPVELWKALAPTQEDDSMYWTEFNNQLHAVSNGIHCWQQWTKNPDGSWTASPWQAERLPVPA